MGMSAAHCQGNVREFHSVWRVVTLDNPDELLPRETFTYSPLSWSSIILYLLPPSIMIMDHRNSRFHMTFSVKLAFFCEKRLVP